jgi:hypothetical protein
MENTKCIWSETGTIDGNNYRHAQYLCENDGGRESAGYKGQAGDCVTRAIAIATGKSYKEIYDDLAKMNKDLRGKKSARNGINKKIYDWYLKSLGWEWKPTMLIGQGCKVHLRADELPEGKLIVRLSKHLVTVVDGVIHDTYDCSRRGKRCVYGYYYKPE